MNDPSTPARRGRPPKADAEAKRYSTAISTTQDMKDRIRAAAERSGRNMTQEIEARLERSFALEDDTGSASLRALLDMVKLAGGRIEAELGAPWYDHRNAWGVLRAVVDSIFTNNEPPMASDADPALAALKAKADKASADGSAVMEPLEAFRRRFPVYFGLSKADSLAALMAQPTAEDLAEYQRLMEAARPKLEAAAEAARSYADALAPFEAAEDRANEVGEETARHLFQLFRLRK